MVRPDKAMEAFMTSALKIYTVTLAQRADGTPARAYTLKTSTKCKWQAVNAGEAFFADKDGSKRVLRIYYPKSARVDAGDAVQVGADAAYYEVLGVLSNDRSLNGLAEVALYE